MMDTIIGVFLCEAKLGAPANQLLNALGSHGIDKWVYKDAEGALGEILIRFDSSTYDLLNEWKGKFSLSIVLKGRQVITSVYRQNNRALRPEF